MDIAQRIDDLLSKSPFRRSPNQSSVVSLKGLFGESGYMMYESIEAQVEFELNPRTPRDIVDSFTPEFQRENNKWSLEQQIKFLENLFRDNQTEILLYKIKGEDEVGILDGLQRSTALADFQENKFPIFGDIFWRDIEGFGTLKLTRKLYLSYYEFNTRLEVVDYYISMNDGITHNQEDMVFAYEYRDKLLAEAA